MNSDEEDVQIIFKPDVAKKLAPRIIALFVVVFLPLLIIIWSQETLSSWFGEPTPSSLPYLSIIALLIGWYAFGLGILLPWTGKRIDVFIDRKAHRKNDSDSYDE
jgi:hypothetical protein